MLAQMTSSQFAEWIEAEALDPSGSVVEDHRAGVVASTIANAWMRAPGAPPYRPDDFFPSRTKPEPEGDEVAEQVHAIFGSMVKEPRDG